MNNPVSAHARIAHNSILTFFGLLIPLIVGIIAIPFVIRGLGVDGFGILSLSWMLLGYFTIFDLGLGRATTKFIAEESSNGETEKLHAIFWSSSLMNLALGCIGGLVIALISSTLAHSVFRIPPALVETANKTFLVLAVSMPIVLISTVYRGTLEAAQRFDYVSSVVLVSSSLTYLLPIAGIFLGLDVWGIVVLLMIAKFCSAVVYFLLCMRIYPGLRHGMTFDVHMIRKLVLYGGWVSVSNVINPILIYLDRFLIGTMISVAAVAYYTAPFEMVARLLILAMSLAMTLFPSFSAMSAEPREKLSSLYSRSMRILLLLVGPLVAILALFSGDILTLWLGTEFASASGTVFKILAVGILFNSIAQIPYALIQGVGHPNLSAKYHLMELVFYIPLVWLLVKYFGIVGGALAWTIRVGVDMTLLFLGSTRFIHLGIFFDTKMKRSIGVVSVAVCLVLGLSVSGEIILVKSVLSACIVITMSIITWYYLLDSGEKGWVLSSVRQIACVLGKTK